MSERVSRSPIVGQSIKISFKPDESGNQPLRDKIESLEVKN